MKYRLALMSGYALARMKLKGADTISLVILSLRFMPGVVIAVPYYLMFQNIGLIIYVAYGLPFAVWLMRGFGWASSASSVVSFCRCRGRESR